MTYNVQQIPLARLELNRGQVPGLPANPRTWTKKDVQRIAASLHETPELFDMRPIIAVENGKKAVILCGSLRFCGAQENKADSVPAIILPAETPTAKLKEIIIKDNGTWGAWDFDALANEWDDNPLPDWGVPAWDTKEDGQDVSPDDYGVEFSLPDGERELFQRVSFILADEQAQVVKEALKEAQGLEEFKYQETFGNTNSNANALYLIVTQWAGQRK